MPSCNCFSGGHTAPAVCHQYTPGTGRRDVANSPGLQNFCIVGPEKFHQAVRTFPASGPKDPVKRPERFRQALRKILMGCRKDSGRHPEGFRRSGKMTGPAGPERERQVSSIYIDKSQGNRYPAMIWNITRRT